MFARPFLIAVPGLMLLPTPAGATRLLGNPTISSTEIAFEYGNDLGVVGRDGGAARRLTSFPGTEANPFFSPDG